MKERKKTSKKNIRNMKKKQIGSSKKSLQSFGITPERLHVYFLRHNHQKLAVIYYKKVLRYQKRAPWFYLKSKKLKIKLIHFLRRMLPTSKPRLGAPGWTKNFNYKVLFRSRLGLKYPYLIKKNPQLQAITLRRYQVYQKLFAYGFFVQGAASFFMNRGIQTPKYLSNSIYIKYDQIVADIIKFRIWTTRRFIIRPIYMRRLLGLYFDRLEKSIYKTLDTVKTQRTNKLVKFLQKSQYSLFSIIYQAFRIFNLELILFYIKAGYFLVNGVVIKNPLTQCFITDIIQLDIFSLFKNIESIELATRGINNVGRSLLWMRDPTLIFIFSIFRNSLTMRPRKIRWYYILATRNMNRIYRMSLQLSQGIDFMCSYYSQYIDFLRTNKLVSVQGYKKGDPIIDFANETVFISQNPSLQQAFFKNLSFMKLRAYSILFGVKFALSTIIKHLSFSRGYVNTYLRKKHVQIGILMNKQPRLGRIFRVKTFLRKYALRFGYDASTKRFQRGRGFVYKKTDQLFRVKISKVNKKLLNRTVYTRYILSVNNFLLTTRNRVNDISHVLKDKKAQHLPNILDRATFQNKVLETDMDIFASSIIRTDYFAKGRRSFLNKSCIRFLFAFC